MVRALAKRIILSRFASIILLLILASCTQSTPIKYSRDEYLKLPVQRFGSINEAFETYRLGIMNIMQDVPEYADQSNPIHVLSQYKASVYRNLSWSYIRKDNAIIALTPGIVPGYWVSFIDLNHPALETRGATLRSMKDNDLVAAVIRPDKISPKWAGIFLVHEFAHLKEYMECGHLNSEESEFKAYQLEKIAVNHITKNRFDEVLKHIIDKHKITDGTQLAEMHKTDRKRTHFLVLEIDEMLGEGSGRNIAELEMRYGFYLVSLSLKLSERDGDNPEIAAKKVKMILETVSLF
jgi:hypothetical protein